MNVLPSVDQHPQAAGARCCLLPAQHRCPRLLGVRARQHHNQVFGLRCPGGESGLRESGVIRVTGHESHELREPRVIRVTGQCKERWYNSVKMARENVERKF